MARHVHTPQSLCCIVECELHATAVKFFNATFLQVQVSIEMGPSY